MTQTIEVNLVDVLNRLDNKIDKISDELKETRKEINQIHVDVEKIKGQNEQITKRLDNVENRLNSMTIGFLSIVGVLVAGLLGIIGKLSFFPNS